MLHLMTHFFIEFDFATEKSTANSLQVIVYCQLESRTSTFLKPHNAEVPKGATWFRFEDALHSAC